MAVIMQKEMPDIKKEIGEKRQLEKTRVDDLIQKAKLISLNSCDSRSNRMWFDEELNLHFISIKDDEEKVGRVTYWSFCQICKLVKFPIEYVWHCYKNNQSDLIVDNLNRWLSRMNKTMLIREYIENGESIIRGVLSERYTANLETVSVLKSLKDNMDLSQFNVDGARLDYERLHLRLVLKGTYISDISEKLKAYGEIGAGISCGFVVENSEIGQSRLNLYIMMYRLACTNGMIVNDNRFKIYAKRHVGIDLDDFKESMKRLPDIMNLFGKEMSNKIITSIDTKYSISQIVHIYENLKKNAQLTQNDIDAIKVKKAEKYNDFGEMWGIINAATDVAHTFDLDKRMLVERSATDLMFKTNKF